MCDASIFLPSNNLRFLELTNVCSWKLLQRKGWHVARPRLWKSRMGTECSQAAIRERVWQPLIHAGWSSVIQRCSGRRVRDRQERDAATVLSRRRGHMWSGPQQIGPPGFTTSGAYWPMLDASRTRSEMRHGLMREASRTDVDASRANARRVAG